MLSSLGGESESALALNLPIVSMRIEHHIYITYMVFHSKYTIPIALQSHLIFLSYIQTEWFHNGAQKLIAEVESVAPLYPCIYLS